MVGPPLIEATGAAKPTSPERRYAAVAEAPPFGPRLRVLLLVGAKVVVAVGEDEVRAEVSLPEVLRLRKPLRTHSNARR
jgi:hypothetical protein